MSTPEPRVTDDGTVVIDGYESGQALTPTEVSKLIDDLSVAAKMARPVHADRVKYERLRAETGGPKHVDMW